MIIQVNEERQVVTAIISDIRKQMRQTLRKVNPSLPWMDEVDSIIGKMPNVCIGVARCSPKDKWDEETGIDIARNRAIRVHAKLRALTMQKVMVFVSEQIYARLVNKQLDAWATVYECEDVLNACTTAYSDN